MADIVGCLKTQVSSADFADEHDNQGLIIQLIRRCLVQPPEGPEQMEILILESSLLTETWLHFHQQLVKNTSLTLQMIQFLKANLESMQIKLNLIFSINCFRLLQVFAQIKHTAAPELYRSLIQSFVKICYANTDNVHFDTMRESYLVNFRELFSEHRHVPIGMLLEPLVSMAEESQYEYVSFDFDFLVFASQQPKLSARQAVRICQSMAQIMRLQDDACNMSAGCCFRVIQPLVSRFIGDDQMIIWVTQWFAYLAQSYLKIFNGNQADIYLLVIQAFSKQMPDGPEHAAPEAPSLPRLQFETQLSKRNEEK